MKKTSTKNKKNFRIEDGCWIPGDLVKIKSSTWSGRAQDRVGVVIEEMSPTVVGMFPSAVVYDMEQKQVSRFYLYDLELISRGA
jgi:hypothetical protein